MKLRAPVTEVRTLPRGTHVDVHVWINHALAGTLTVRKEEEADTLRLFAEESSLIGEAARRMGWSP